MDYYILEEYTALLAAEVTSAKAKELHNYNFYGNHNFTSFIIIISLLLSLTYEYLIQSYQTTVPTL